MCIVYHVIPDASCDIYYLSLALVICIVVQHDNIIYRSLGKFHHWIFSCENCGKIFLSLEVSDENF